MAKYGQGRHVGECMLECLAGLVHGEWNPFPQPDGTENLELAITLSRVRVKITGNRARHPGRISGPAKRRRDNVLVDF